MQVTCICIIIPWSWLVIRVPYIMACLVGCSLIWHMGDDIPSEFTHTQPINDSKMGSYC